MTRRITTAALLLVAAISCRTVGVSTVKGGYAEVSASVAHEMILDTRQIIVLDIRRSEDYATGHIAGAISTPLSTIEDMLPELLPYQRATLLLYGDERAESAAGARLLVAAGFRNVVRIRGGLPSWIKGGYPTVPSQ